ncbi:unnamed protein product [Soboliphyme baturini]|uniref:AMP-binding_C domain-containing protein n=1 Tax=Soboliphyme baturini TaxID=241478 RepID=A0A183IFG7_9BILA|nr:unnamed protein product [Soboliphyme baturini]
MQRMVKEAVSEKYDLTNIRHVVVGAAPVGQELCKEFVAKFPHVSTVSQGYGLTETAAATNMTPALPITDAKFNSCGILTPFFECKIIDLKTGEELKHNEQGELCFKGPLCTLGYYKNAKATAELYDKDGWLHTGDIGYYDEDEFFYIVDRLKELIKVKGFQVTPSELEEVLLTHPNIEEVTVIGIPDSEKGERPFAYVIAKSSLTAEEVAEYLSKSVAPIKRISPKDVAFVESLPKTSLGKPQRRMLQKMHNMHSVSTLKSKI